MNLQSPFFERVESFSPTLALQNELLRGLFVEPQVSRNLRPDLKVVSLEVNQVLYESGDKIDSVYFPLDSIVSSLAIMEDGTTMETSMVGTPRSSLSNSFRDGRLETSISFLSDLSENKNVLRLVLIP
jgi:CRP-like cAMP-binding protein